MNFLLLPFSYWPFMSFHCAKPFISIFIFAYSWKMAKLQSSLKLLSKDPDLSLYRQISLDLSWNPKIQTLWKYLDLNLTFTAHPSLHKNSFSYLPTTIKASCCNSILYFFFFLVLLFSMSIILSLSCPWKGMSFPEVVSNGNTVFNHFQQEISRSSSYTLNFKRDFCDLE